jgi:hypothetical protein
VWAGPIYQELARPVLYLGERIERGHGRARYLRQHPLHRLRTNSLILAQVAALYAQLMRMVAEAGLRREYSRLWQVLRTRPEPKVLRVHLVRCAMHYHFQTLARQLADDHGPIVNSF